MSEIADQVGYHVLVATSAVLLKNRDSLGGPDDMVGSVSHVAPGLNGRATSQVSVSEIQTAPLDPRRFARHLARRRRHANDSNSPALGAHVAMRCDVEATRAPGCAIEPASRVSRLAE